VWDASQVMPSCDSKSSTDDSVTAPETTRPAAVTSTSMSIEVTSDSARKEAEAPDASDELLGSMMAKFEAQKDAASHVPSLIKLAQLLRVPRCVFCGQTKGCSAFMNCGMRRLLLRDRPEKGWCFKCDLPDRVVPTRHVCAYLEFKPPAKVPLDVCGHCLWPMGHPEVAALHSTDSSESSHMDTRWMEANLKSTLGVYLFRERPYGIGSWAELLSLLNQQRHVPWLSSGHLLVQLYQYLVDHLQLGDGADCLPWASIREGITHEDQMSRL